MSHFDRNNSNNLGARSKIRVSADSNARRGKKKEQNGNSNWDEKKLWEAPNERNKSFRSAGMDTWDNVPTNGWNDARNKKDSWEESMRKKKENPTLWNSIEQDFPSLGSSQQQPRKNVWTERQQKFEEVKCLQPTTEAEEEKMIKIALEMSKFDVRSDEANRKRLEEEYELQQKMLEANPDHFKEFVPEVLCNVGNNFHSEGYATAEQNNFAHNNNWDTWNDYSNFGVKNNTSKDTLGSESAWNDSLHGTTKSASQTNSKQKGCESIWGEVDGTSSGNWNGYSDSGTKNNFSTKSSSNYNTVDSFNDTSLKTTQKPKTKTATRNVDNDSIWGNYKNSDDCNDYSDPGNKKNSTAKDGSNYKSGDHWDDWSGNSDSKKTSYSKNSSSYKNDNHWNDSTDKSHEQSTKNFSNNYECDDAWDNDVDYNNTDNADARDRRNYSNLAATSGHEEEPVFKGSKVSGDNANRNSGSKADNKKMPSNSSSSGKKAAEDIKKVVDLFGGWGSASDYSRKPNTNDKSVGNMKNATDNHVHDYKKASHHEVTNEQSVNYTTAVNSQSTSKLTMHNSSIKSKSEFSQNSVKILEGKAKETKLSEDIKSEEESQNSYLNSEMKSVSRESSEVKKNYLMIDDHISTPTVKTSDFLKSSDAPNSSIYNSNIHEHHTTKSESLIELNSLVNERLPTDSISVSYTRSPKLASVSPESAGISKPIESHLTTEFLGPSTLTAHSSNLNDFAIEETSQTNQSNDDSLEFPVTNSPSVSLSTDAPFESPINPILPIHPMIGGFMNSNMNPSMMPGMNPNMMPAMNPNMMPGVNPMMVAGMNPLLMQQMLFFSNPFLASQIRAMEMYYKSMGMTTVPQGMFPPEMCSTPGFNGSSFPNATDNNCDSNTMNAPVPPNNYDIAGDSTSPAINPPNYPPNSKLSISLNDDVDTSSHILRYDPDDADSLLQQFLDPCDNDNYIPPPVMPKSRNENAVSKQNPPFSSETFKPTNSNASSFINPAEYKDNIGNNSTNSSRFSNSETSWNETVSAKGPIAAVPESTGWGDFDSDVKKSNWNDEIDGWGDENYTSKAMGNPSKYDSKKKSVIRQPSSQPTFRRYKK